MAHYPILITEMAKRGIQKKQIAQVSGVCEKALYNKLTGKAPFTWPEVSAIRLAYFPDMTSDELFTVGE